MSENVRAAAGSSIRSLLADYAKRNGFGRSRGDE